MSFDTITVNIAPLLSTPGYNFKLDIDNQYKVLDLILFLVDYDSRFKDYGIILPENIRVDPTNIKEKLSKFIKNKILNIKVPPEDDNWDISNLAFIIVGTAYPVAYNKHCLTKMIDNNSILIPHINKKFKANTFINNINNFINIVKFNYNDIVY